MRHSVWDTLTESSAQLSNEMSKAPLSVSVVLSHSNERTAGQLSSNNLERGIQGEVNF